jgi:DNA-binding NarL/FixJ family response regulator
VGPELAESSLALVAAITARRAQILARLAEGFTEREIAGELGLSLAGVRSHVSWLREAIGLDSGRELGRWWRSYRETWLDGLARLAGLQN